MIAEKGAAMVLEDHGHRHREPSVEITGAEWSETDVGELTIEPGDPAEPAVARLLRMAEEYSQSLYPPESIHMLPVDELSSPSVRFVVARSGLNVHGCGATVLQPDACAELKRMFVDPAARRRGIAARILTALEDIARAEGVRLVHLETGTGQPEAIGLYHRFGYRDRGPFGDYVDDPLSVYMDKSLDVT